MIHSLLQRTASFLNLQQSPVLLYMYFDNPEAAAKAGAPPYEEVLDDYRLWCSLIAADNLGSLQSGRASWAGESISTCKSFVRRLTFTSSADPTSALRVGRRFATLGGHPTDVRRTAILELYSIITVPPSAAAATRPVRYRLERLPQINAELERWRAHWKPLLDEAQRKGDPLAYTVERTLACFVSLSVNGATFSRWSLERQKEIEQGKEGRPKLTQESVHPSFPTSESRLTISRSLQRLELASNRVGRSSKRYICRFARSSSSLQTFEGRRLAERGRRSKRTYRNEFSCRRGFQNCSRYDYLHRENHFSL